ncbi:MAG: transcriptional regulator GcvA [Desulfobacterales bacterium]|nr:transcriptional regulator GcvA [Desulfobacterales bacterium]
MDHLPSLNALKAFEAVARHLNFTRAAKELCVTQGAVSRQVKNLEAELGIILFTRVPNNLQLTADGDALYRVAHQVFDRIREAVTTLRQKKQILKIIMAPTFATRWLIPRLYIFHETHPGLQIQLETSTKRFDFLYHTDFDAAIAYGKPNANADLVMTPLMQENLYPVCAPGLITPEKPLAHTGDIRRHCLLHSSLDRKEWRAWAKMMGINELKSSGDQCFELEESTIQATKLGAGIALANQFYIRDEIASGDLIFPFPDVPPLVFNAYYLVYDKSKATLETLDAFIRWLQDEMDRFLCTADMEL